MFSDSLWGPIDYSIQMTKAPRPGYNTGGTSFATTTPIDTGVTQYGSIDELELGQFYKVHLEAGQLIHDQLEVRLGHLCFCRRP